MARRAESSLLHRNCPDPLGREDSPSIPGVFTAP
jgi:hypothetical protein